MRIHTRYALALLAALLSSAQAAGPTGEAEAFAEYAHAHRPVWVSANGAWRVSLTPQGELLREAGTGGAAAQRLKLGAGVRALASHGPGLQVWALGENGCLVLADFSGPAPKRRNDHGLACTDLGGGLHDDGPAYFPGALAVSADGRLLAHGGGAGELNVQVLDLRSKKTLRVLALAEPAQALRFEDEGQRLAVLTLQRGEQWEDIAGPSNLQWSRWDLASGALWNEAQRPGAFRHAADYLHAASAWQQFWLHPEKGVQALDLQTCPVQIQHWPLPELAGIQSLAADPQGRWLALLEPRGANAKRPQRVIWLDAPSGRILHISALAPGLEAVALQAHGGGLLLRRAQALPREGTEYNHSPWRLQPWQHMALPPAVAALPARAALAPAALCREPQEAALARQPERIKAAAKPLWSLAIDPRSSWAEARSGHCNGSDWPNPNHGDRRARRWGLSPQGQLFLDQGDELHQLDPGSGKLLARWPTPRPTGVCSTPSFARAQFLNWQGDTLSLRPFAAQWDPKGRQILEQRPGWQVYTAVWLGDQVLARWVKGKLAEQRLYRADASGRWTKMAQRSGTAQEGLPWFEGDDGNTSAIGWHELMPDATAIANVEREERGVRAGPRWSAGRYGSVRAEQDGHLLLWDGVSGHPIDSQAGLEWVLDLGGGRAVAISGNQISVYRLREPEQAPQVWRIKRAPNDELWSDALALEAAQLLLVEVIGGRLMAVRLPF